MANVAGSPAISLPAGFSSKGLPVGIQLASALGQEQTLLELAYELEEMQPWPHLFNCFDLGEPVV
jgi:amidase